jgi:hypothetical protein
MQVQVNVASSTYLFGIALTAFVGEVKKALEDGWQPTADVPAIVLDAIKTLAPVIGKLADIPGEAAGDTEGFANAIALTVIKTVAGK